MKRLLVAALACASLALSGCALDTPAVTSTGTVAAGVADATGAPPPVAYADRTAADEKTLAALELAWTTARALSFFLPNSPAFSRAEAAIQAARAAYATANAASWREAVEHALAALAAVRAATGR